MHKEKMNSVGVLVKGTVILSVAAFLTKVLSAVYRVPFQNIVGDIGFYIYQQIYPFYGIAVSFAIYGFPVIISKLYAEQTDPSDEEEKQTIFFSSLLAVGMICLIIFFLLYAGSETFASFMGDERLQPLIRAVSFSYLTVPVIAVVRGYFQGTGIMQPTAISQVTEQLIRVVLILFLSVLLVSHHYSLYDVGAAAILSSVTGSLCGMLLLLFLFIKQRKSKIRPCTLFRIDRTVMKIAGIEGLAICISSLSLLLFQLCDSFQILSLLIKNGTTVTAAQVVKGIYDRGQPLLQIGMIIATSLSLSVVPMIAGMKQRNGEIKNYVRIAFQISFAIGTAAATGLILIMNPLNEMLFENDSGSNILRVYVLSIILASLSTTAISILQGFGKIYFSTFAVLAGVLAKVTFNQILVGSMGITGAAVATNAALAVMAVLLLGRLHRMLKFPLLTKHFSFVLLKSLAVMTVAVLGVLWVGDRAETVFSSARILSSIQAVTAACAGGIIFSIILIRGNVLSRKELVLLPFGKKLLFLLNGKGGRRSGENNSRRTRSGGT